jgi:thiol-disulfide isomerase/thioredoxin
MTGQEESDLSKTQGLEKVELRFPLLQNIPKVYEIPLFPLNCTFGVVTKADASVTVRKTIKSISKLKRANAIIVFAVRRPGCANCREYAVALDQLATMDPKIAVIGAVKETGVADAELLKFYEDYFRRPMFLDEKWRLYKAMGGKKLSWPQLIFGFMRSEKRYKRKGIENKKFGGDLHTQGGLFIFDKKGRLRYALEEEYGKELDIDAVKAAVSAIREGSSGSSTCRSAQSNNQDLFIADWI